jgi:hypothetical protein
MKTTVIVGLLVVVGFAVPANAQYASLDRLAGGRVLPAICAKHAPFKSGGN